MRREDQRRELEQFVEVVKAGLRQRLKAVSLELLDIGLKEYKPQIITLGVDSYALVGWVVRPATGQQATFSTRIGANIGETSPADVEPMVTDLVMRMVNHFYAGDGDVGREGNA